jgi:hypothetical protein
LKSQTRVDPDGWPAAAAALNDPAGLLIDSSGALYIALYSAACRLTIASALKASDGVANRMAKHSRRRGATPATPTRCPR